MNSYLKIVNPTYGNGSSTNYKHNFHCIVTRTEPEKNMMSKRLFISWRYHDEQTVKLLVIWDAMMFMCHHCDIFTEYEYINSLCLSDAFMC